MENWKFARSYPEVIVMDITPELAKEMLATSAGNRALRSYYVDLLVGAMKRGEWRLTNQGIGFDTLGRLRDAHHRLHAVVKSGVTIQSVVTFGMPINSYEVIDTGKIRTLSDRLSMNPKIVHVIKCAIHVIYSINSPTSDQAKPLLDTGLVDVAEDLLNYCSTSRRYFSSGAFRLCACIAIMSGGNADYVKGQYRALCLMDFDNMSRASQSIFRNISTVPANRNLYSTEIYSRAFICFDEKKKDLVRPRANENDKVKSAQRIKDTLLDRIKGNQVII